MWSLENIIVYALLAATLLPGLYFRCINLGHNIENPHLFRQAQTASDIPYFIVDRLSIEFYLSDCGKVNATYNWTLEKSASQIISDSNSWIQQNRNTLATYF